MLVEPTARMSNVFPPMISSSPPPIDIQDDEDEDEDFGDFRVADLSLNSPDATSGSLSPCDRTEGIFPISEPNSTKEVKAIASKNENVDFVNDPIPKVLLNGSKDEEPSETSTVEPLDSNSISADKTLENNKEELSEETKPPDLPEEEEAEEDPEIANELESIPFQQDNCVAPPASELRTSPEGADSDSGGVSESNVFEFRSASPYGCAELKEEEFVDVEAAPSPDDDFDDFCEFADFSSHDLTPEPPKEPSQDAEKVEFAPPPESSLPGVFEGSSEPLDDFDDFEFAEPPPVVTSPFQDVSLEKRVDVIFPNHSEEAVEDPALTGCLHACLDDSSSVWGHLKDLECSPALTLQWSNSSASKKLLSALNIDSRNILIGSRLNSSVPRFAANMSCAPLEPLKAEAAATAPSLLPPLTARITPSGVEDVVPAAQFDWNSSGLTNPLDSSPSALLNLDFLIKFDNISSSSHAASCVWTPFISMEKEETRAGSGAAELREPALFPSVVPPSYQSAGKTWQQEAAPSSDAVTWSTTALSSTDILLPSPAGPPLASLGATIPEEKNIPVALSLEDWLGEVGKTREEPAVEIRAAEETLPEVQSETWTISSQLERVAVSSRRKAVEKSRLSAEACRVVDALPDLSFLSARKLLFAANENSSRFHTTNH